MRRNKFTGISCITALLFTRVRFCAVIVPTKVPSVVGLVVYDFTTAEAAAYCVSYTAGEIVVAEPPVLPVDLRSRITSNCVVAPVVVPQTISLVSFIVLVAEP